MYYTRAKCNETKLHLLPSFVENMFRFTKSKHTADLLKYVKNVRYQFGILLP